MSKKPYIVIFGVLGLLSIVFIFLFLSFNSLINSNVHRELNYNLTDDREIFVRIKNETKYDFESVRLGSVYEKPNSYKITSFATEYKNIPSDELSEYMQVSNISEAYDSIRVDINSDSYAILYPQEISLLVPAQYSSVAKWKHPYLDEYFEEPVLRGGYYTFIVSNYRMPEGKFIAEIDLEILKDR